MIARRGSPAALALAVFILAAPLAAAVHAHRDVPPPPCEDDSLHLCAAKSEPHADPCVLCRAGAERETSDVPAFRTAFLPDRPAPETASGGPVAIFFSNSNAPRAPPADAR
jgi:hypothetical protein